MTITGLGPHGERAAPPSRLDLSESDSEAARRKRFNIAVVLHTTVSDWSKQQLAGIVTTLGRYSAAVVEVVDCQFSSGTQVRALERLANERPDAIISIPIGNAAVAEAHRAVSAAGVKLILIDNAPTGLLPGTDYVSVVSADNFGLGKVAAELLAPHIPQRGTVGVIGYRVDFFATNEREIAFKKWMESERPDIIIQQAKFVEVDQAAIVTDRFLNSWPDVDGLFAVWDVPASGVLSALRARSLELPLTTVDLGNEVAVEMARGPIIKGIAAQQPYDQGVSVAAATILSLIDRQPPPWVALPALAVTAENVIEAYQVVWHAPAPIELVRARRG